MDAERGAFAHAADEVERRQGAELVKNRPELVKKSHWPLEEGGRRRCCLSAAEGQIGTVGDRYYQNMMPYRRSGIALG
jgi:hypothetical protein